MKNCGAEKEVNQTIEKKIAINIKNWPNKNDFNYNITLDNLIRKIKSKDNVIYSYVIESIRFENNEFKQIGSEPNFQG